jgi:hypothetical protein
MSSANGAAARKLLEQALSPLKAMKRKPGGGVGMFPLVKRSSRSVWYADILCARFLRAGLPHECWADTYYHHQRHDGWDNLACEECEDAVLGVESLVGRRGDILVRERGCVIRVIRIDCRVEIGNEPVIIVPDCAKLRFVSGQMASSLWMHGQGAVRTLPPSLALSCESGNLDSWAATILEKTAVRSWDTNNAGIQHSIALHCLTMLLLDSLSMVPPQSHTTLPSSYR